MLLLTKPVGMTPAAAIEKLKLIRPELASVTVSYAGRLDPMADGLLLLLVGDENKTRHDYEALEKTYVFTVLLGVSTDTYDILGLISKHAVHTLAGLATYPNAQIEALVTSFSGTFKQPYPPYSSKPVQGKPLYWWAREGRLSEIIIPEKKITITSLLFRSAASLSASEAKNSILDKISLVKGDFRQEEIRATWQSFFDSPPLPTYPLLTFEVTCTSGTYVRSIAQQLGEELGSYALAFSITRTKIGDYTLQDSINIDAIG